MKRYLELSRQRDRLWLENQALQDAFEEREKVSFRFQRLFDVNYQLVSRLVPSNLEHCGLPVIAHATEH